jgi:peptide/nickel transport system substrate-binding protein
MYTSKESKIKSALSRMALIAVIVVIIVIVAIGGYAIITLTHTSSSSTTTSSSGSTSGSTTTTSSSASGPGPANRSQLVVEENEAPNSYDPASGFFAGESEIMVNTYQELLMFNYTSLQSYAPILAQNWTISPSYLNYTFNLRNNAYFANGQPFNASAVWFNIYRVILMDQVGAFYFTNLLYNGTTAFATGYSLPAGVDNALAANGYSLSSTNDTLRQQQAALDLSRLLSNFNPSNSTIKSVMSYPHQAIVVQSNYQIQFNLVNPYLNFLQVMAVPGAGMVEPSFVDAHGGVLPNNGSTYVNTHTMGSGPYEVQSYTYGEVVTLVENPNYWASKLSASQSNIMLSLPTIPVIILEFASTDSQIIQSITQNTAALIGPLTLPALTPNYLPSLAQTAGIQVHDLPNAPKFLYLTGMMNNEQAPYNNSAFRRAIVNAINYTEIESTVGVGYTQPFVGPIAPGYAYYNPGNLKPYSLNLTAVYSNLGASGYKVTLPNGTVINPSGKALPPLSITYVTIDQAETKIAQEMQTMFANVGLTYTLNGVTTQGEESAISQPGTAASYPGLLLWYWYPSWSDAVYQDLVVVSNTIYGGISGDVSWYNNTQVNSLTTTLPFLTNTTQINATVAQVYSLMYNDAPDIWIYAVNPYWVQRSYVTGVFDNVGTLGFYYALIGYS